MASTSQYYHLTKPGIIRANVITAVAGYLYAAKGKIDLTILVAMAIGVALVIAAACISNNYIDRKIDKKMERTKKRALVTGVISVRAAAVFAAVLGASGLWLLLAYTNWVTALLGIAAFVLYVVVYGYVKRRSVHGTLVGAVPGALALVAGYTAVTGSIDQTAWILFLIMVAWQMPHFYAISIYRLADYQAAKVPVLSAVKGVDAARKQIVAYICVFGVACMLLPLYSYAGIFYTLGMLMVSIYWLQIAVNSPASARGLNGWAKKVFGFSLVVLLVFCVLLSLDSILP